jgi:C4-dicarboxylate-specific signal transduction histidine kinase
MLRARHLASKPIDLNLVVRESLALIDRDLRARKVQVDVIVPPEPCVVMGDQVLLQQVLVNLIMNAMEAMAETPPERRHLRVLNDVRKDGVESSVRDSGPGLPPNVDGHVFDPFVTTKANGMGIGLTIARTIVEAHRGTLEAHNNPEGGATFRMTLPHRESA